MKTNRVHRKGGKSKAVSQGQTSTPNHLSGLSRAPARDNWPSTAWLTLHRNGPKDDEYEIRVGAEAMADIRRAGLSFTDLEPTLAKEVATMPPCTWCYVDYPQLIGDCLAAKALQKLADAIGLGTKEAEALALLSEWWGKTPVDFAREVVTAGMSSLYDEMEGLAMRDYVPRGGSKPKAEVLAWADKFYPKVKALRPKAGWQV